MEYRVGTKVFKDWEITKEIGQGGFGTVFEIEKNNYGVKVKSALKVIKVPRSSSEVKAALSEGMDERSVTAYFQGFVDEVVKEIELMSSLKSHPAIVGYEDHAVIPHENAIGWDILIRMELLTPVMDYQMNHAMDEETVIKMARQITNLLAYCQSKGMIHRDIKPENIFVNELGQFKLGDFGVARTIEKTTGGLSRKGTESYMAPEVYKGQPYGASVDVYSLGLVLYRYMNNNRLPFFPPAPKPISYSDKEKALEYRMSGQPIAPPANGSDEFSKIILKACAYKSENRYHSAEEMLYALNGLQAGKSAVKTVGMYDTLQEEKTVGMYDTMQEEKTVGMYDTLQEEKTVGMYDTMQEEKTVGMYDTLQEEKTVGMYDALQEEKTVGMYETLQEEKTVGMYGTMQEEKTGNMHHLPKDDKSGYSYHPSNKEKQVKKKEGSGKANNQKPKKKSKKKVIGITAVILLILAFIGSTAEKVYQMQEAAKEPVMAAVTVTGAEGSGIYEAGSTITLLAEDRTAEGYMFKEWTLTSEGESQPAGEELEASFIVPEEGLNITAVYEELTDEAYVEMWEAVIEKVTSGRCYVFGEAISLMSLDDVKEQLDEKGIAYDDTYENFISTEGMPYELTYFEDSEKNRIYEADMDVYWYDEAEYNSIDFEEINSIFKAGDSGVTLGMSKEEAYATLGITDIMMEWLKKKMKSDTYLDWTDENERTWYVYYSSSEYSDGESISLSFATYNMDEYNYVSMYIQKGHVCSIGFQE